jgi:GNAT superfamily N-acetyltransferase
MNDGLARDLEEGPVHEQAGRPRDNGSQIETQISIRVSSPSDRGSLRRMLSRASSETIYRRFHIPYQDVPEQMLALMLDVDHHDGKSLVAVAEEEIVGHAMYVRDGGEAEMAIIVEDGWQSMGVGKTLLSELAERARLRGIEIFTAEVLGTNRRMLGLAAMFAGTDYTTKDGLVYVRMPLRALQPTSYAA